MRAVVGLFLLGGCLGVGPTGGATGGTRPAVMPMLSELPDDPTKRDAVLDSANTTAGPEQRQGQTPRERKVETAAATAAAILGELFSKTKSVTIGTSTQHENQLLAPLPAPRGAPSAHPAGAADPDPPKDDAGPSNADLIPWIKVK